MSMIVPFVHRLAPAEEAAWLSALGRAVSGIELRPLPDLTASERRMATVAVVADPDPADLAALPALLWVQSLWAGVERLLRETPPDLRIVRLVDPQLSASMAEAVLAWTLYLHRDMPLYARQQAARVWRQHELRPAAGRRIGVLGLGHMGMAAVERLRSNGFPVIGWSREAKPVPGVETGHGADGLAWLLERADIAVILLPLTSETQGLMNDDALSRMKRGASLINFGRGAIVDREALFAHLDAGALDHAVLDVFATEPLPDSDPHWSHPRVTVLPHISAPTDLATASAIVAQNLRAFLYDGRIPESVDRARGY
jgi:glyoxylate/hydroxypyruvate reductase A